MKLSIWQQFSSNHSASYTVVGMFESVEKAQQARDKLIQIHEENAKWYRDNDRYPMSLKQPSPVEEKYAKQYGFDWKEELDWAWYHPEKAIEHFDKLVIVTTRSVDTWQTGHQFVNLLSAMGASTYRDVYAGRDPDYPEGDWGHSGTFHSHFVIELHCTTANDTKAQHIHDFFTALIQRDSDYYYKNPIEWLSFHPDLALYSPAKVKKLEAQYLADLATSERTLKQERRLLISRCRDESEINTDKNATVKRDDMQITIKGLRIFYLATGLQVFTDYLRSLGCKTVEYKFKQGPSYLYRDDDFIEIEAGDAS